MASKQASEAAQSRRKTPSPQAASRPTGRPPILREPDKQWVLQRLQEQPQATLEQLAHQVQQRSGKPCSTATLRRFLHGQGIFKRRPPKKAFAAAPPPRRYGYKAEHRDGAPGRYPSSLTDAEWALVQDLFEHRGAGRKAQYDRRHMVDAICYVVRSGCPWRMLPREFPRWQNVYATFRRWSAQRVWETMHDRLRAMWRQRVGREVGPTAAVLDSQSVATAEKGGLEVLTEPSV